MLSLSNLITLLVENNLITRKCRTYNPYLFILIKIVTSFTMECIYSAREVQYTNAYSLRAVIKKGQCTSSKFTNCIRQRFQDCCFLNEEMMKKKRNQLRDLRDIRQDSTV